MCVYQMSVNLELLKAAACQAIDQADHDLQALSRHIWSNPELAYQEQEAHRVLTDFLSSKDFQVERGYHLPTAFCATFCPENACQSPSIAVLCEYDALPEIGHACGHNLIAEVGIAAGLGIQAAMKASHTPLGKLVVLGTPAEEEGGGKIDLLRAGAFEGFDAAIMAHPGSISTPSTQILAMIEVKVTYRGKASHAAGFPWEGVNALDAAVMAYNSISVMRQQCKPSWRIHGIITNGGVKPNIIPEETQLHYYLRTPTSGELDVLVAKAKPCFQAAAMATGCDVEFEWDAKPYANMLNNETLVSLYHSNSESLGVKFCTDKFLLEKPSGSTDMGNVSHALPAIHPNFHIGTDVSGHTHGFRDAAGLVEAQQYTLTTGKALAMTAIDLYCQPELLHKAKAQHKQDLAKDSAP